MATFPDATTTGVPTGTVLTPINGNFTTSFDGQVIDARDVSGTIVVNNNNVTIRNSEATDISVFGANCVIEDSNIVHGIGLLGGDGAIVRRCDISNFENGIWIEANNVQILDNWFHDPIPYNPSTDPHVDGIQIPGGEGITNVLIQHNRFDLSSDPNTGSNSDIQIGFGGTPASGPLTGNNIDIIGNYLSGGTFNLYFEGNFTGGDVLNNTFGSHIFGYVSGSGQNLQHYSGNVDGTSGQPILGGAPPPPVDTTPPLAPDILAFSDDTGALGDHVTSDHTLLLSGSAEANSVVKLFDGAATLLGQVTANSSGAWSFLTGTLSEVAHHFTATATDAAGNVSPMSGVFDVTVEAAAPPPPDEFVTIVGTSKNNNLVGTSEVDHIFGQGGDDVLTGLGSADQLTGGTGNDRFDFNALADSLPGAADTIMDFVHASDRIDLRTIDANTSLANNQAFVFGGQNSAAISHGVTWHEANGETVVTANVTGGTHVDFELHLAGTGLHLAASDFLL